MSPPQMLLRRHKLQLQMASAPLLFIRKWLLLECLVWLFCLLHRSCCSRAKKKPLHFTCFHHTTPHAWKIMNFYVYLPEKMNYIKERVLPMPWLRSFLFHLLRVWKWKWNIWLKKDCIWIPHRYFTWFQNLKRDNIVWKAQTHST
jgi:hypothetical protein